MKNLPKVNEENVIRECCDWNAEDADSKKKLEVDEATPKIKINLLNGYAGKIFLIGRNDQISFLKLGLKQCKNISRGGVDQKTINSALLFIFRPYLIQLLSWAIKRIGCNGTWMTFSVVEGKEIFDCRWCLYDNNNRNCSNGEKYLGRTLLIRMEKGFTKRQKTLKMHIQRTISTGM